MELLLSRLVKKGIRIGATDDALRIQAGNATLTDADKQELRNSKPELIDLLKNRKVACLSYPQERLWFLAQLGYSRQYHIPSAVRIKGKFNAEALKSVLKLITQRHESFRTSFRQIGDLPIQFIEDKIDLNIEEADLSNYNETEKDAELRRLLYEFIERPFDLEEAPLI
ncbi:MAG: condensation domain-containing protein, partial [Cyclobacteriaceae bacterium]